MSAPINGPADPIPQTDTGDVCYDLGGYGQTARSLQPCTVVATDEPPAPCQEDQPCWNCAEMGNLICGPTIDYSGDFTAVSVVAEVGTAVTPVLPDTGVGVGVGVELAIAVVFVAFGGWLRKVAAR